MRFTITLRIKFKFLNLIKAVLRLRNEAPLASMGLGSR